MITLPNGKICMNEQEAIQWLLDNYPIPFQCSANYAPLTEIGLGTIVNPTPAKVKVGSIIFFADSKVSTVVGVTSNGFICSDQYNDLVDDVVYVSNVQLNASGHLIVTLSNGTNIDAGLIKQVSGFSVNASQHLIASYNDGTSTDLGAIFSGNITISGNLTVTGGVSASAITGDSIIENMNGYTFVKSSDLPNSNIIFAGACKNGNKITFVIFGSFVKDAETENNEYVGVFGIPANIGNKLYPYTIAGTDNVLAQNNLTISKGSTTADITQGSYLVLKQANTSIAFTIRGLAALTNGTEYFYRIEQTFLLSENLAA